MTHFHTYSEAVNWIEGLGLKKGNIGIRKILARVGHPERRLKFYHVAGTNGKGSTCAFLSEVLRQHHYDVGTLTSPYIEAFTNRIRRNGQDISEADVLRLANQLKSVVEEIKKTEGIQASMAEVITSMAMLYFSEGGSVDFAVLETGMGGKTDSTNVVTPLVSIITNVGHDHLHLLGPTLSQVADHKAGTIKEGVPVVSAVEQADAIQVIQSVAEQKQSPLYLMDRQFRIHVRKSAVNQQRFDWIGPDHRYDDLVLPLNGLHQCKNAAVAMMALDLLRQQGEVGLDERLVRIGLRATRWPGRLEQVSDHPPILLDGAHNPEGAQALADALRTIYQYKRLILMVGLSRTKDHSGFLKPLPLAHTIIFTESSFGKKMDARLLVTEIGKWMQKEEHEVKIMVEPSWKAAIQQVMTITEQEDLAVVTGSLYLISDVRAWVLDHI